MKQLLPKYALHPGHVYSHDGDCHWVGYWQLIRLYKLHPRDCIEWNDEAPETYLGRRKKNYIHLHALSNGRYLETRLGVEYIEHSVYTDLVLNMLKDTVVTTTSKEGN